MQVNTEGCGVYEPYPGEPQWVWWAWTPDGLMIGKEPTRKAAREKAREAKEATKLKPKGQG